MSKWPREENRGFVHPDDLHDRATCQCHRCRGFQPGNKMGALGAGIPQPQATKHGAFKSPLVLRPEAEKIAEQIRPLLPVPHPAFEGTLQSYCITLVRIQKAYNALEDLEAKQQEDPDYKPNFNHILLGEHLMKWQNSARKDAQALGLTPESAVKILKDAQIGNLAQQTAILTQQQIEGSSTDALLRAREILQADVVDAA